MSSTDPKFGLSYSAEWSGVYKGSTNGGPYSISGNGSTVVNQSPQVTLNISNYNDTGSTISLQAEITVDSKIGDKTVFNETLSGNYPVTGFEGLAATIEAAHSQAANA